MRPTKEMLRLWFRPSASCRNWTTEERLNVLKALGATQAEGPADADVFVTMERQAFLRSAGIVGRRGLRPWTFYVPLELYEAHGPACLAAIKL